LGSYLVDIIGILNILAVRAILRALWTTVWLFLMCGMNFSWMSHSKKTQSLG